MSRTDITHFSNEEAMQFGIEEAILISYFAKWILYNKRQNKNFKEGRTWTYQSYECIGSHFPFWSKQQVRRFIKSLVEKGVLMCNKFNKMKMDQTRWYAFADEERFVRIGNQSSSNVYDVSKSTHRSVDIGTSCVEIDTPIPSYVTTSSSSLRSEKNHPKPPQTPPCREGPEEVRRGSRLRCDEEGSADADEEAGEEAEVLCAWVQTRTECTEAEALAAYWAAKEVKIQGKLKKDIPSWMFMAIKNRYTLPSPILSRHRCIARAATKKCKLLKFYDDCLVIKSTNQKIPCASINFIEKLNEWWEKNNITDLTKNYLIC